MSRTRPRRRRVIVDGFQARFVLVQLTSLAVGLLVFAILLFGPLVYELLTRESAAQGEIASLFLHLHSALWPLIVALFATLGAVFVLMSHRIAGPVYRFRLAFREVLHGKLNVRVKTREHDYLVDEAAELDSMIRFLSARVGGAQRRIAELEQQLEQTRSSSAASVDVESLAATVASLKHELAAFVVDAPDQATYSTAEAPEMSTARPSRRADSESGFSLIEILIGSAIVGTLSSIAVPVYSSALEAARVGRATADIRTLDREISLFFVSRGCLPTTLQDIQRDTLRDPWGSNYLYGAIDKPGGGGGGGGGRGGGGGGGGGGASGCTACAGGCIGQGTARKDRRLVPINSDFDVYSMGKDGKTSAPLTAHNSQDDVVRGNNGGFIGLARTY